MTLTDFCRETKNWFEVKKYFGKFEIADKTLEISSLQTGQYFRIVGSIFNDGVYQYPETNLKDEVFDGAIWAMAVPKEVMDLITEMTAWETANADAINSPYQSESFGGYSYSKASGTRDGNGDSVVSWQNQFAKKLNKWRKI